MSDEPKFIPAPRVLKLAQGIAESFATAIAKGATQYNPRAEGSILIIAEGIQKCTGYDELAAAVKAGGEYLAALNKQAAVDGNFKRTPNGAIADGDHLDTLCHKWGMATVIAMQATDQQLPPWAGDIINWQEAKS